MKHDTQSDAGHASPQVVYVAMRKSRAFYILFAFLFGGMGIHDFYAGYIGKGLLKILVSILGTTLIFLGGVGAMIGCSAASAEVDSAPLFSVPLIGVLMLTVQSLYILLQIIFVKSDAKGLSFY